MLTRNRGKPKSVLEALGLIKRSKKSTTKANRQLGSKKRHNQSNKSKNLSKRNRTLESNSILPKVSKGDGENSVSVSCSIQQNPTSTSQKDKADKSTQKLTPDFQSCDKILLQMLKETSELGQLRSSKRHRNAPENRFIKCVFREKRLGKLFSGMVGQLGEVNFESDRREAYLAPFGLVRAEICAALRSRRSRHSRLQNETAACSVSRLRPHPRPRRFSDMVNLESGPIVRKVVHQATPKRERPMRRCIESRHHLDWKFGYTDKRRAPPSTSSSSEAAVEVFRALKWASNSRKLTLLDKVVLGLSCSVVQESEGTLIVKSLAGKDLNILLQRIVGTGFRIESLSTQTVGEEEQFNITLSYQLPPPPSQGESRRQRHGNAASANHRMKPMSAAALMAGAAAKRLKIAREEAEARKREEGGAGAEDSVTRVPSGAVLPFRRHSPRKVIRKVYTGSSTVPKILNRRRLEVAGGSAQSHAQRSSVLLNRPLVSTPRPIADQPTQRVDDRPVSEASKEVPTGSTESALTNSATTDVGTTAAPTPTTTTTTTMNDGNPAHLLCASQLLRMKRSHEDQDGEGGAPSPALSSQAPPLPSTPNPPSAYRNQRKLNPAGTGVPSATSTTATAAATETASDTANSGCVDHDEANADFELVRRPASLPTQPAPAPMLGQPLPQPQPGFANIRTGQNITFIRPERILLATAAPTVVLARPFSAATARPLIPTNGLVAVRPALSTTGRRPVVHKFHTFRKISPKQQQLMLHQLQQGRAQPSAQPASIPPAGPSASQLLKSLLQSGAGTGAAAAASTTSTTSTTTSLSPSGPPSLTASSQSSTARTVPHQSRGTWQLGGRAIVLGASITTPTTNKATSQETSLPDSASQ